MGAPTRAAFAAMAAASAAAASAAASAAAPAPLPLVITVDTSAVVNTARPEYLSFNFDYHMDSEEWPAWNSSSIINMSLTDPNLLYLAGELAPAFLRVGGSEGDNVTYETPTSPCPPGLFFCMTMARWAELANFTAAAGLRMLYGLNAMAGRANASAHMDLSNIASFLRYLSGAGYDSRTIYAFEFGNELTSKVEAAVYAQDAAAVKALIAAAWPEPASRPGLVGNDENPDPGYLAAMLAAAPPSTFDAVTWHQYSGYGLDPTLASLAWSPAFMDIAPGKAAAQVAAARGVVPGQEMWVGETAMAWHSGGVNVTDTFLSGPWLITQMGALAATHGVQCRQTLKGGYYELVDRNTMAPNPDYVTTYLWKRTLGGGVLNTTVGAGHPDVRVYAHCAAGGEGLALAFVNMNASVAYSISVQDATGGAVALAPRGEYVLTPGTPGVEASRTVALNGVEVVYAGPGSLAPQLQPAVVTDPSAPLVLAPHTYGFVTLPHASSPCSS